MKQNYLLQVKGRDRIGVVRDTLTFIKRTGLVLSHSYGAKVNENYLSINVVRGPQQRENQIRKLQDDWLTGRGLECCVRALGDPPPVEFKFCVPDVDLLRDIASYIASLKGNVIAHRFEVSSASFTGTPLVYLHLLVEAFSADQIADLIFRVHSDPACELLSWTPIDLSATQSLDCVLPIALGHWVK